MKATIAMAAALLALVGPAAMAQEKPRPNTTKPTPAPRPAPAVKVVPAPAASTAPVLILKERGADALMVVSAAGEVSINWKQAERIVATGRPDHQLTGVARGLIAVRDGKAKGMP